MYLISKEDRSLKGEINISGSKSESNRLLIIRAYTSFFKIINLSDSDDTNTLISALESNDEEINIGHAGTAMRFLTSYFSSTQNSSKILTGSERMKERPISILVDALIFCLVCFFYLVLELIYLSIPFPRQTEPILIQF